MQKNKSLWFYPWGFIESVIIVSAIMLSGFLIDVFSINKQELFIAYPLNIIVLIILFFTLSSIYFIFRKNEFLKWLSSAQLAIVCIAWLLFLVLLMGLFKQGSKTDNFLVTRLHFNNILQSSAFILLQLFLIINLSFALFKRFNKFSIKNTGFIFNHLGIVIIIIALGFGNADIKKYTVRIFKDNYTWKVNHAGKDIELSFAFQLVDFQLENFPAKIGIIDNKTDEILKSNKLILQAEYDSIVYFNEKVIRLKKYLKNAVFFGNGFHPVNEEGAAPAALIEITGNTDKKEFWISSGSHLYPSVLAPLDTAYTLAMLEPEAKNYKSEIKVFFKDKSNKKIVLEVNKPVNISGWNIYLTDYNKEMGKWSDYSVIEMVYDPWLNVVYFGVFLMILGVILFVFTSKHSENGME